MKGKGDIMFKEFFILSFKAADTRKAGKLTRKNAFCHYWQAGEYGAIMLVKPDNKPFYQFRNEVMEDANDLKRRIKSAVLINTGRANITGSDEEFAKAYSIEALKKILHCAEEDDMFSLSKTDLKELSDAEKDKKAEKDWEASVEAAFFATHKKKDAIEEVASAIDEMVEETKEPVATVTKEEITVVTSAAKAVEEEPKVDETGQLCFF